MEIDALLNYFGVSAQHPAFDALLATVDLHERPAFDPEAGNPVELIELHDQGLCLEFIKARMFERYYGIPKDRGAMVFYRVRMFMRMEEDYQPYRGALPLQLPSDMTPQEAATQLGMPSLVRDETDAFGRPNCLEYVWKQVNGLGVFVHFRKRPPGVAQVILSPPKIR
jgi:hypothetical protein